MTPSERAKHIIAERLDLFVADFDNDELALITEQIRAAIAEEREGLRQIAKAAMDRLGGTEAGDTYDDGQYDMAVELDRAIRARGE